MKVLVMPMQPHLEEQGVGPKLKEIGIRVTGICHLADQVGSYNDKNVLSSRW